MAQGVGGLNNGVCEAPSRGAAMADAVSDQSPDETAERERDAFADLAETARYHADRLPAESSWQGVFNHLAVRLEATHRQASEDRRA